MNATYYRKPHTNNFNFESRVSKKGNYIRVVRSRPALVEFAEKCIGILSFIYNLICSEFFLKKAKIAFSMLALVGFISTICGAGAGVVLFLSGCICLTLSIFLEYLISNDESVF